MSDDQQTRQTEPTDDIPEDNIAEDATRAGEATPIQKRPRELPRRGYEGSPRPMSPPPPPPISPSRPSPSPPPVDRAYQPRHKPVVEQSPPPPPARAAYAEYARKPKRRRKSDSGLYLPWWSLVLLIMVVGVGAFGLLYIVLNEGGGLNPGDQTPRFVVVTRSDQNTISNNTGNNVINTGPPGSVPTTLAPIATAVPIAEPTITPPGVTTGCPLDSIVEVVGVAPAPLLIRPEPRQSDDWTSQAVEGEQLKIVGGPETSAGVSGTLEWCRVEGVTNQVHSGWAARSYLVIVSE